jgi:hypothetical protein
MFCLGSTHSFEKLQKNKKLLKNNHLAVSIYRYQVIQNCNFEKYRKPFKAQNNNKIIWKNSTHRRAKNSTHIQFDDDGKYKCLVFKSPYST